MCLFQIRDPTDEEIEQMKKYHKEYLEKVAKMDKLTEEVKVLMGLSKKEVEPQTTKPVSTKLLGILCTYWCSVG